MKASVVDMASKVTFVADMIAKLDSNPKKAGRF